MTLVHRAHITGVAILIVLILCCYETIRESVELAASINGGVYVVLAAFMKATAMLMIAFLALLVFVGTFI